MPPCGSASSTTASIPHTVGGAERWYRNLAERLAAEGHEVDYLTLRQWPEGEDAGVPGVRVIAVGPRMELYAAAGAAGSGRRSASASASCATSLRHGRRLRRRAHGVVPVLLAAGSRRSCAPLRRYRLVVDWHEVWTQAYWREYLGRAAGAVGWRVQRLCLRIPQRAFCFSRLHERRLREEGFAAS